MSLLSVTLAEPQSFQPWEKLLLLALIIVSAILFLSRLTPILSRILKSKKDPNFSLAPVGKRIWEFFWEVLCQAKVIRERPLPGLAHAFVFWGFCAFALVTLNHFAVGFGLGFLDPAGFFGPFYSWLAAVFAAACAIGIFGLFVRRFFVRPRWLGQKVSYESGIIAAAHLHPHGHLPRRLRGEEREPRRQRSLVDSLALHPPVSSHSFPTPSTSTWSSAPPPSFSRAEASAKFPPS